MALSHLLLYLILASAHSHQELYILHQLSYLLQAYFTAKAYSQRHWHCPLLFNNSCYTVRLTITFMALDQQQFYFNCLNSLFNRLTDIILAIVSGSQSLIFYLLLTLTRLPAFTLATVIDSKLLSYWHWLPASQLNYVLLTSIRLTTTHNYYKLSLQAPA